MNGREYSDPRDLPSDLRAAYEKAMRGPPSSDPSVSAKRKLILNGQVFETEEAMPVDVRKICDDITSLIENNGEVTLPQSTASPEFVTRGKSLLFVGIGIMFAAGVVLLFHHSR